VEDDCGCCCTIKGDEAVICHLPISLFAASIHRSIDLPIHTRTKIQSAQRMILHYPNAQQNANKESTKTAHIKIQKDIP
jgi:hypothetical protein